MYEIKNGILFENGRPTFALGESYYPSFHPSKFPVPPEGDRIGEMKKDLRMMREAGFNHVRFAALGDVTYCAEREEVTLSSPFVDAMIQEAERNDLSVSVRLEGFSVNLRGFDDADILNARGEVPTYAWDDFVRTTLHHKGILEDNFVYARDLSKHFRVFPNVVGFQIYNEPKYPQPNNSFCDYNPYAVTAFRKWLISHGILTPAQAESYQPPRTRGEQSPKIWALWRLFNTQSLTDFLENASKGVKSAGEFHTFTCYTADMSCKMNCIRGVDAFGSAKSMDIVGYTMYMHAWGSEYYPFCFEGDIFVCAAKAQAKESWCVELDSRTYIPSTLYNRGTYATIGAGVKGILYYQWRGDAPVPGVPFPNSCGILNYDGSKTKNFDNAVAVNRYIASINDLLMGAERACDGIGLFYSHYALAIADATMNQGFDVESRECYNLSATYLTYLYTELRKTGYTVTVTDGEGLKKNLFGIRALVVPDFDHISPEERAVIEAFYDKGGEVFISVPTGNTYHCLPRMARFDRVERTYQQKVYLPPLTAQDIPALTGIVPKVVSLTSEIGTQVLVGEGYTLLVLTNIACVKESVDALLRINFPFKDAIFTSVDGEREAEVNGDLITVKGVKDGGILVFR